MKNIKFQTTLQILHHLLLMLIYLVFASSLSLLIVISLFNTEGTFDDLNHSFSIFVLFLLILYLLFVLGKVLSKISFKTHILFLDYILNICLILVTLNTSFLALTSIIENIEASEYLITSIYNYTTTYEYLVWSFVGIF